MPKLDVVENKIADVEKFRVSFRYLDKSDVRGDLQNIPQYGFSNKAHDSWTVSEWIMKRFKVAYPGFEVYILKGDGSFATGGTRLATVRSTY